jgi:L-aminopeptidase/D-esterase-like protein
MRSATALGVTIVVSVVIQAQANSTLTAVPGIKVGHFTLTERPTGCTVILAESGVTAGVDVRGAAPATAETELLRPVNLVQQVHAIVLSGGSAFGLDSRSGVMRYLDEKNIGFKVFGAGPGGRGSRSGSPQDQPRGENIPIVPAASLFDFNVASSDSDANGRSGRASSSSRVRPTADCGYRAAQAATAAPVAEGNVGAGAGATIGKTAGPNRAMKGGLGSAAIAMPDGLIVAAIVAVNAAGDVIEPATGRVVAGVRTADGKALADARVLLTSGAMAPPRIGENTTLGVIATNAALTKVQATRVAEMAHDGYARAIFPSHTMGDGDTIFALATASKSGEADVSRIGALAAKVMADAIVRAAMQATGIAGYPAARDLR